MSGDAELAAVKAQIAALYEREDEGLRARFERSLPLADAVLQNRWTRAARLGFGDGTSIYDSALVLGDVKVGARCWIGPGVVLDGSGGGLVIGDNCSISAGVHVYTHDTVLWAVSGGAQPARKGAVMIGDCCYLGAQSVVVAGVRIGTRAVVAANSLVNRDVADGVIVGGVPARRLGAVVGEGVEARLVYDRDLESGAGS